MTRDIDLSFLSRKKGRQSLFFIAGPCQIESREHCLAIAAELKSLFQNLKLPFIFKASYDKANRTSGNSERGVGIERGLEVLSEVRETLGIPVLTDIHETGQVALASTVVDVLQIPAFLCRQTDLLYEAGKSGKVINIKKGQFLAPSDMQFAAEKVESSGNKNILLCERGTCFGYRDLIVDPRSFIDMARFGYPVVFDATHSVQKMGGAGGSSTGNREYVPHLCRAAVALGVAGLFIECHDNPDNAPSDGANMLRLKDMPQLVSELSKLHNFIGQHAALS